MAKLSTETKKTSLKKMVGSMTPNLSTSLPKLMGGKKTPKLLRRVKVPNISTDIKMGLNKFKKSFL